MVNENQWFEEVQHELCQILNEKLKFISIYQLNGELNFEDAILQTLFNGLVLKFLSLLLLFSFK